MRRAPNRITGFESEASKRKRLPRSPVASDASEGGPAETGNGNLARTRIMYIENKSEHLNNRGRIGRVRISKTGKTLYYAGKTFQSLKGGYKANYFDIETGEKYWISGPKKDGGDRLYGTPGVDIDEDVREEYWLEIRELPGRVKDKTA